MLSTPWEHLRHVARYLAAARSRLEKLPAVGPVRDAQAAELPNAFERRADARLAENERAGVTDPALERFRWMIEELRVSVFAQELGTAISISPKRLERQWELVRK
jgi:ATP-dependent helicase HrpA